MFTIMLLCYCVVRSICGYLVFVFLFLHVAKQSVSTHAFSSHLALRRWHTGPPNAQGRFSQLSAHRLYRNQPQEPWKKKDTRVNNTVNMRHYACTAAPGLSPFPCSCCTKQLLLVCRVTLVLKKLLQNVAFDTGLWIGVLFSQLWHTL